MMMEQKYKWFMVKWLYTAYYLEKDNLIIKIKVILILFLVYVYDKTNNIFS
jgi:hypothetical protein